MSFMALTSALASGASNWRAHVRTSFTRRRASRSVSGWWGSVLGPMGVVCSGANAGRGSASAVTGATVLWVVCMAHPRVLCDGSMACRSAMACCAWASHCWANRYIGSLAVSMALQRLRLLSACICRWMGSGVLWPVVGTWDCTAACAGEVVAMTASKQVRFSKTTAPRPIRAAARQVGLPGTRLREPARLAPACRATIKGHRQKSRNPLRYCGFCRSEFSGRPIPITLYGRDGMECSTQWKRL